MELNINSPWGKLDTDVADYEKLIEFAAKQLYFFKMKGSSTDTLKLDLDIKGYEELLASPNKRKNCQAFIRFKQGSGIKFLNNMAVIARMKKDGLWL